MWIWGTCIRTIGPQMRFQLRTSQTRKQQILESNSDHNPSYYLQSEHNPLSRSPGKSLSVYVWDSEFLSFSFIFLIFFRQWFLKKNQVSSISHLVSVIWAIKMGTPKILGSQGNLEKNSHRWFESGEFLGFEIWESWLKNSENSYETSEFVRKGIIWARAPVWWA